MDKDFDLDAMLAEAAAERVSPSPDLTSRILQDADRMQPKPQPFVRARVSQTSPGGAFGWFAGISDVLGGSRALAGLSFAAMTGLYLGVAQPNLVLSLLTTSDATTVEQIDLLPANGNLWTEN